MKNRIVALLSVLLLINSVSAKEQDSPGKAEAGSGPVHPATQKKGYDLNSPDIVFALPLILHEISGITYIDQNSIGCIQDENGVLFIYDILNKRIKKQLPFHYDGDYEGIALAGRTVYVLRSDGTIFEISDYSSQAPKINSFRTNIPARDNEGLCYDQKNNRLLIACKGRVSGDDKMKNKRFIYSFSLKTKTLIKDPLFIFDVKELREFAGRQKKGNEKDPEFNLETSAIAIHPVTGELYLLSASDNLLFVFNMNGSVVLIDKLKNKLFPQAEGITFFPNGDMLISNEGRGKEATLLRFNYR